MGRSIPEKKLATVMRVFPSHSLFTSRFVLVGCWTPDDCRVDLKAFVVSLSKYVGLERASFDKLRMNGRR